MQSICTDTRTFQYSPSHEGALCLSRYGMMQIYFNTPPLTRGLVHQRTSSRHFIPYFNTPPLTRGLSRCPCYQSPCYHFNTPPLTRGLFHGFSVNHLYPFQYSPSHEGARDLVPTAKPTKKFQYSPSHEGAQSSITSSI